MQHIVLQVDGEEAGGARISRNFLTTQEALNPALSKEAEEIVDSVPVLFDNNPVQLLESFCPALSSRRRISQRCLHAPFSKDSCIDCDGAITRRRRHHRSEMSERAGKRQLCLLEDGAFSDFLLRERQALEHIRHSFVNTRKSRVRRGFQPVVALKVASFVA